jgi:hypothetical protein
MTVALLGEVALLRYLGLAVMMGRSRRTGCFMGKSGRKKRRGFGDAAYIRQEDKREARAKGV